MADTTTTCPTCPTSCPPCTSGNVTISHPSTSGTAIKVSTQDTQKKGPLAFIKSPMFLAFLAVAAVAVYVFYFKRGGRIPFLNR